jgi:2-(1,2-epoxy-1,2-dihydrophenyl)acetyl-CoA isomerase
METLELTIKNGVGCITLDRPEAMNTLNNVMADELLTAIQTLNKDNSVAVIMLCGAGSSFMAGGDIDYFYKNLESLPTEVENIIDTVHQFVENIVNCPKPVIAAVHGSVAGIGMSFMLACDLVIAAEGTKFTTAYSKIGITPDGGCTYFLPRLVGFQKAKELIMLSTLLDAEQAKDMGLINFIVPAACLTEEAERLAQKLLKGPKLVYAKVKNLVNQSMENDLAAQLNLEKQSFRASTATKDFKEGVTAFIKKQKPEFEGV